MKKYRILVLMLTNIFLLISSNAIFSEDISLSFDKDLVYYIETEDEYRLGHDWETNEDFSEIRNSNVSSSVDETIISLPTSNNYFIGLYNTNDEFEPFDMNMQTPHTYFSLRNAFSSYDYPNIVYTPALVDESDGSTVEIITLLSYPDSIPQIIFEPEMGQRGCQIIINPVFSAGSNFNQLVKIPISFDMFHAYEYGEVDIALSAIDEINSNKLQNAQFDLNMTIVCVAENNNTKSATTSTSLPLKSDAYIQIFYKDMLDGSDDFFYADLDGNGKFEIESPKGYFDIQEANITDFSPNSLKDSSDQPVSKPTQDPGKPIDSNGFRLPDGIRYTLPDDDAYILKNALKKETIIDGDGTIGTFYMEGKIYNDGEKNGYSSYFVDDDELIIGFQVNTKHLSDLKKQGWKTSDDLAKSINGCKLIYEGDECWLDSGALAIQVSGNGKDWVTYDVFFDWLDNIDRGNYVEFTPDPRHLATGCYYRIIFAYELKREKSEKKFLGGKYDYANYAEVYEFYLYNEKAIEDISNSQQYSLGKKIKTGNNFFGEITIDTKDKHYGWDLGNFFITGYTEHRELNGNHIFLKNVGDEITLWFNLNQDIDALNGSSKLKIKSDKKITDQYFELPQTNFYRGALIIRHTDYQNITHDPVVYTDYLQSYVFPFANTKVELFEEGDYEVALDYSIDKDHYRIAFNYSIRNSNCMVFPFDVVTKSEMVNSSYTEHGFYLDLARSRYLDINVKRVAMVNGVEDVRFNKSARDGEQYTDEGIYIITVRNNVTGEQTEKRIYVGADYKQYSQN